MSLALAALALAAPAAGAVDPYRLAGELAALGPRAPGTPAHARAEALLLNGMAAAGLSETSALVEPGEPALRNLVGILPGRERGEIVLSAHYDSVPGSPGALDDASGCGVVLAAVADLARTPLRRAVRVVLFDGEEGGLLGSRAWVARLDAARRRSVLAALDLDMVGWREARGPALSLDPAGGGRVFPPGWLVHAALAGSRSAGVPLGVPGWSPFGQLVGRAARPAHRSDADSLLAAGLPALLLTDVAAAVPPFHHGPEDTWERLDAGRLEAWSRAVAAVVRRLDGLAGRPAADDQYVVLGGRVWHRRVLYWVGLGLWAALVVASRPGAWRGTDPATRRLRGRRYLPAFLFRSLFLLSFLVAPVWAATLVFPLAPLALVPARTAAGRRCKVALAAVPALGFAASLVAAHLQGRIAGLAPDPLPLLLVGGALAAFWGAVGGAPHLTRRRAIKEPS